MEGTVSVIPKQSPPRTELGGTRKGVNIINEFNFDLQRFEGEINGTFTKVTDISSATVYIASSENAEGGKYYNCNILQDAVNAVAENGYIKLLRDMTDGGIGTYASANSYPKNTNGTVIKTCCQPKNFTIDFGGHIYTVTDGLVGSPGTVNQAFHLEKLGSGDNVTVTLKNGSIVAGENAKASMFVQNYCNLTYEDITLDGTALSGTGRYVSSNNCGNVTIKGNTSIIAKRGDYAFDVCSAPNKGYSAGTHVTVNTTGKIKGDIELGLWGTQGTEFVSTLKIENGVFEGEIKNKSTYNGTDLINAKGKSGTKQVVTITGGTFTDASVKNYVAQNFLFVKKADNSYFVGKEGWVGGASDAAFSKEWKYVTAGSDSTGTLVLNVLGSKSIALSQLAFDGGASLFGIPDANGGLSSWNWGTGITTGGESYFLATYHLDSNSTAITITPQTTGVKILGESSIFGTNEITKLTALGSSGIYVDATQNKLTDITGGDGNDTLIAGNKATSLIGNDGNDWLIDGKGNDWLEGGSGADRFFFGGGSDIIADYKFDEDIFSLSGITKAPDAVTAYGDSGIILSWKNGGASSITFLGENVKVSLDLGNNDIYTYTADWMTHGISATLFSTATMFSASGTDIRHIYAEGASSLGVTITGSASADKIWAGTGTSILINGGGGSDWISLAGASGATVDLSLNYGGHDTIGLSSAVKSFTVNGFSTGDVIKFGSNSDTLSVSGQSSLIVGGKVTINGLTLNRGDSAWTKSDDDSSFTYNAVNIVNVAWSGTKGDLVYSAGGTSIYDSLFSITGLSKSFEVSSVKDAITVSGMSVWLTKAALSGADPVVAIHTTKGYTFGLSTDVPVDQSVKYHWTNISGTGNSAAFYDDWKDAFYSVKNSSSSVVFTAASSSSGKAKLVLSGLDSTSGITRSGTENKIFSLSAGNFGTSGITVVLNNGYGFSLASDITSKTFTGSASAETIYNYGNSVTIDGGGGNDLISLFGVSKGVLVNVGSGSDTISVGADVKAFGVSSFELGDVIRFGSVSTLTLAGENFAVGNVTISGFSATDGASAWHKATEANTFTYDTTKIFNVGWSDTTSDLIFQQDGTSLTGANLFTIAGISSTAGVSVEGNYVVLGQSALNAIKSTSNAIQLTKGTSTYSLSLAGGVPSSVVENDHWERLTNGNFAFMSGAFKDYYHLVGTSKVTYVAKVAGDSTVILSGAETGASLAKPVGNLLSLSATDFGETGITVIDNVGNYSFSLADGTDYSNKSFTGTSGADNIFSYGTNLKIYGEGGNDIISVVKGSNVSVSGGGGSNTINLGISGVFVDVSAGTDNISVGAGINAFSVSGFAQGDDTITITDTLTKGSLSVGTGNSIVLLDGTTTKLTITGFSSVAKSTEEWFSAATAGGFSYMSWTTEGAKLNDQSIAWEALGEKDTLFTIAGLSSTVALDAVRGAITVSGNSVYINATALSGLADGATVSLTNGSGKSYAFALSGVSGASQNISDWKLVKDNQYAYMLGATSAYFDGNKSTLLTYHAETPGTSAVILSGVKSKGGLSFDATNKIVGLSSAAFGANGDVTVVLGSASYAFTIENGTYPSGATFTGMSIADTITNYGEGLTIFGLSGADSITNYGANVSIDGGIDSDLISLLGGDGATVNVGIGNDTIYVDNATDKVKAFTVAGFSKGDVINLSTKIDSLGITSDGALSAGTLTITGIGSTVATQTGWGEEGGTSISYLSWSTSGATIDGTGKQITWQDQINADKPLFTINGLGTSAGITVGLSGTKTIVTFSKAALSVLEPTDKTKDSVVASIILNDNNYEFAIAKEAQFASHSAGWHWKEGTGGAGSLSHAIYKSDSSSAGFKITGTEISYVAGSSTPVTWVELSGIANKAGLSFVESGNQDIVSITATAFGTGASIAIVGNSGSYRFLLDGDLTGKSFYGTSSADTVEIYNKASGLTIYGQDGDDQIINSGDNVSIYGEGGNDQITNTAGKTVLIDGGANDDTIQISGGSDISINALGGDNVISLLGGEGLFIDVSQGDDTIYVDNTKVNAFTVSGFSTSDVIKVTGSKGNFSISGKNAVFGDNVLTISGLSAFALPDNDWADATAGVSYRSFTTSGATFDDSAGTIVWSASNTAYENLFTIKGLSSDMKAVALNGNENIIGVSGTIVTLSESALTGLVAGNATVALENVGSNNYSLSLGTGVDTESNAQIAHWADSVAGHSVIYYSASNTEYWAKTDGVNNSFTFNAAKKLEALFRITGLSNGATGSIGLSLATPTTLQNGGYSVVLTKDQLAPLKDGLKITISGTSNALSIEGVTAQNLTDPVVSIAATFTGSGSYHYTSNYTKAFFEGITGGFSYHEGTPSTTFDVTGLANKLSLSGTNILLNGSTSVAELNGTVLTLNSLSALGELKGGSVAFALTSSNGYSLAVDRNVFGASTATQIEALFKAATGSGAYVYTAEHNNFYTKENSANNFTYYAEAVGSSFAISGLATGLGGESGLSGDAINNYITVNGASVTVGVSAVGDLTEYAKLGFGGITLNGGDAYKSLTLADALLYNGSKTHDAGFTAVSGNSAVYMSKWNEAYFSAATQGTIYNFTAAAASSGLFTLTGISATDGIKVGATDWVVTLGASALAKMDISLTGGASYTLALDSTIKGSENGGASFSAVTNNSASYISTWVSEGYNLLSGSKAVKYTAEVPKELLFTISGIATITNAAVSGTVVTLGKDNLKATDVTLTNLSTASYSLSLGSNVAASAVALPSAWNYDEGKATYVTGAVSSYYSLSSPTEIVFNASVAGASAVVLDGVAGTNLAALSGTTVNLTAADFSASGVTVISGSESYAFSLATGDYKGYTFTGMSIADTVNSGGNNIAINVGADNDLINLTDGTGATLTLGDGNDTINVGTGVKEFTVTDFTKDDVIVGSFSSIVAISGGIQVGDVTIKGITDVAGISNNWAPSGANISYVSTSTSGATLDGGKVTLVDTAGGTSTLFTIFGVNSTLGVSLDNTTVTLGQPALADKKANDTVSLSGAGYTLALSGVAQSATVIKEAGFNNTTTYSLSAMSGYWGANGNNAYILNDSTAGAAQFSIAGASALVDTMVDGTTVNIGEANLTGKNVTLTNLSSASYALALDSAVKGASTLVEGFASVSGNSAAYLGEGNTAGYAQSGTTLIAYTAEKPQDKLFTLTGIANTTGVAPSAGVVTVSQSNVAQGATVVAITGSTNYTLAASDFNTVGTPSTAETFSPVNNHSASFIRTTTYKDFWTATNPQTYTFTAGGSTVTDTLFTINGISTIADTAVGSNNVITLSAANFAGMSITLSGGASYSLALDKEYPQTTTAAGFGELVNKAATYYDEGTSESYTKASDTLISYAKGQSGAELFTASDITSTTNVNYAASAITATGETNAKLTLTGLSSAELTIGGFAQITGFNATNQIVAGTPTDAKADGSNLVVTTANGAVTIDGASAETVNLKDGDKDYTAAFDRITDVTAANAKSVSLTAGFEKTYYGLHQKSYASGVTAVDATNANTTTLNLTGSKQSDDLNLKGAAAAANSLTGGKGNDTLTGGGQGDVLKGNAGADVFVQSAGNDTISDYTFSDGDVISFTGTYTGSASGADVIFTTDNGTIFLANAADNSILVNQNGTADTLFFGGGESIIEGAPVDSKSDGTNLLVTLAGGSTTMFTGDTVMTAGGFSYSVTSDKITNYTDENDKKVTLTSGFEGTYYGLHQKSYGKGVTAVDATKANTTSLNLTGYKQTDNLTLTGTNNGTNTLTGGKGNDTLKGGTLNDVLKGNAGNDLFIQSGGNDTISDYTEGEDTISLVSAYKDGSVSGNDVVLTTDNGTILLADSKDASIAVNYVDGTSDTLFFGGSSAVESRPVDVTLAGDNNLSIELENGDTVTAEGNSTLMTVGGISYSVVADRITDVTDENDKKVTLASGFDGAYYGLHQKSYGKGVTAVDATKANTTSLNLTGYKQTDNLTLTGTNNGTNIVTGGKGDDTIAGGTLNDTLKGNAGADVFVQTAGNDTIVDYMAGEDVISLQSELTNSTIDGANVVLTTGDGTIVVENGVDNPIKTSVDGKESMVVFLSSAPTDAKADGENLVVTTAKGDFTVGGASDAAVIFTDDAKYTVAADRITDVTVDDARSVTLTSGFTGGYYGMHNSYATGVTTVNASKADTSSLSLTGFKSALDLNLKGTDNGTNIVTGGKGNDTLMGGKGDDSLKGNAGADLFIQSEGNDTILDYAAEDTIQLASTAESSVDGEDILFTNSTGTIRVSLGSGLEIKTTVVSGANNAFATSNDELWGINGEKDTFLFDGGKDTIHNYEEQDEINLGGYSLSDLVSGAPSVKDNNLIFEFDKQNSFTVSDAVGKDIAFTDGTVYSRNKK